MKQKRYKKIVEWEGEYGYEDVVKLYLFFNCILAVILLFVWWTERVSVCEGYGYITIIIFGIGIILINISIWLSGFMDKTRKVYWVEDKE